MRDLAASPARRRRSPTLPARWRALTLAALALLLAGCSLVMGLVETEQKLSDAGIQNPSIDTSGFVVTLTYDPVGGPLDVVDQQETAAQIIWTNLPLRIDQLEMIPRSANAPIGTARAFSRAELEQRFGARPEGLDNELGDAFRNVLIAVGVAALVVLVLAVVIVILVVRAVRKRRQQPQPAYAWQGPGGQAWPPQPPAGTWPPPSQQPPQPPPGYGQPPAWRQQPPAAPPPGAAPPPWQPGAPPARPEQQPPPPGTSDPWWSPPPATPPAGPEQDRDGEGNGPAGRREPPPAPPT